MEIADLWPKVSELSNTRFFGSISSKGFEVLEA